MVLLKLAKAQSYEIIEEEENGSVSPILVSIEYCRHRP